MKKALIAVALVLTPTVAAAQSVTLAGSSAARPNSLAPSERPRLSYDAQARIEARVLDAAGRGIPAEPMRRLATEAQEKFVSESRIMASLSRLEANLQTAKRVFVHVGRPATDAEIIAGGDAIAMGTTEAQLGSLITKAPAGRSVAVAIATLNALVDRGEQVANAVAAIETQLAARATDASIASMAGMSSSAQSGKGSEKH